MARHNEQHPRQGREQGRGRAQERGQDRGLGRVDLRYMLQMRDAGESDFGNELYTDRSVEVVHIQDGIIIPNSSSARETKRNHSGHPWDKRTTENVGRTRRKDMGTGHDAGPRFSETGKRHGSQEKDVMLLVRMSRPGKRVHPDNKLSGAGFFRNDKSRSPERDRRKKHKLNANKGGDNLTVRDYHNPGQLLRKTSSQADLGSKKRKCMKENENGNLLDRMQSRTHRYNNNRADHEMTTATDGATKTSVEPIDSEKRIKSSSTAEKEDLASLILRTVCVDYPGKVDLAKLRKTLHQKKIINFSNTRPLYDFLKHYGNIFEIEGDTDRDETMIEDGEVEETAAEDKFLVIGHPNLLLCQQHSRKAGSCTEDCRSLHICKYFVLSKCTMQEQRKKCIFGHDMDTEHNKEVLRKSLLHTFKTKIETDVLCALRYRNSTTVPAICSYYNKPKGCNKAECGFMHVCSKFLHGTCSAPYMCNLSHDIMAKQPLHCLHRCGISPSKDNEKVVVESLKSIVTKKCHPVEQGRPIQSSSATQGIPKPCKGYQEVRYFTRSTFSTSGKIKESEKFTKANNQNRQVRVEVEEGQEKEQEVNLSNSLRGVWTWSWKNQDGAWSDVTDSQIFEAGYKEYMQARKRSFIINDQMCEVDFATKTGVFNGEVVLSFKRVRKPDSNCPTSDISVTDVGGSDADAGTKTGVTEQEDALDIKRVVKPECDTRCSTSYDTMDDCHVTNVAGSDADAGTKTGVTEREDALDIKRVVKPEGDTRWPMSDITNDSHVADVAVSDADAGTKTGVTEREDALDINRVSKPECDTKCSTSDVTDDSHVTDVAGSDAGVAADIVNNGSLEDSNQLPGETP